MKKIILLFCSLFMLMSFCGCSNNHVSRPDTNLEFWIADNVDHVDFSNYQEKYGLFGGRMYYGTGYTPITDENGIQSDPDHCVLYTVTSYPDYSSKEQHITSISITDPSISIYGLTLESSRKEIKEILSNEGFDINISGGVIATKGDVTMMFTTSSINIRVEVTNKMGIQF